MSPICMRDVIIAWKRVAIIRLAAKSQQDEIIAADIAVVSYGFDRDHDSEMIASVGLRRKNRHFFSLAGENVAFQSPPRLRSGAYI